MPDVPDIPAAALARVAGEIGRVLRADGDVELAAPPTRGRAPHAAPTTTGGTAAQPGIAESFEVWRIDLGLLRDVIPIGDNDLRAVARPDARWHHQVRMSGERATHYARSSRREEEQGALLAVFESGLATAIDAAIDLIDATMPDEASDVRLLLLPELYVAALWVVPPDEAPTTAVLVQSPNELGLREQEPLPGIELRAALRELDRAVPLHPDRDPTHPSFDR